MNLDKTSNLGQKFATLNILLYRKQLHAIAGFIQVQLYLPSLFIDNVKPDDSYKIVANKGATLENGATVEAQQWRLVEPL